MPTEADVDAAHARNKNKQNTVSNTLQRSMQHHRI